MAGAPLGNQNAADGKVWRAAIRRALRKRGDSESRTEALDKLAEALLRACEEGQIPALRELGDRLEGKAAQQINVAGADGGDFIIQVVKFADTDSK